ncbi:MAG: hypothetical protein WCS73_01110 [Lentisphaeria bacterium]
MLVLFFLKEQVREFFLGENKEKPEKRQKSKKKGRKNLQKSNNTLYIKSMPEVRIVFRFLAMV